jgi:hypothetical protein
MDSLGVRAGSPAYRAVSATVRALASADGPGVGDYETSFAPGRAYVRRVSGHNLWILYRFDDVHVFIMTARGYPPVPLDE